MFKSPVTTLEVEVALHFHHGGNVFYVEDPEFGRIKIGWSCILFTLRTTGSKVQKFKTFASREVSYYGTGNMEPQPLLLFRVLQGQKYSLTSAGVAAVSMTHL